MSDGSRLRQSWYSALSDAEAYFRQLLTSPPTDWKRLTHSGDASPSKQKGKARLSSVPELADVVVQRNSNTPGEDVYKMVLEVPTTEEGMSLEPWKAVLTTPELRQEWDPAVEDAHLLEMFDRNTRISKTNYTLGWPSNPRDSVTISRAFQDENTVIDITTSLPRSPDEPAYLRPSPPFVRSHVQLFAWCIQYVQPTDVKKVARLRMTCFWQHDLKAMWGLGSSTAAMTQQLATMTLSLFKTVIKRGGRVPKLVGYGNGVSVEHVRYQIDREALAIDYAIIPDDDDHVHHELGLQGMDEVHALREYRRLTRSIECILPSSAGWDIQVTIKGSSAEVENIPWSGHATRSSPDQILFRLTHGALTDDDAVLKVKVVIEVSGGTRGLRVNGLATKIHDLEERDPTSRMIPQKILQDVASAVDLSIQTSSSMATVSSAASSNTGLPILRQHMERTPAAEKSILSKVRRNYIYFSSLLQEPEAKWRRTTEARGVSITQLDSIDPTLVVYRAEATFVGVGLWDLYGAVVSPGARVYWDKQHEDGVLLEDVNELTELWHFKTKPAWPVNGRDSVVLKTVYKSPTTIHVFSFSAEDPHLFPHIPPAEPNVIRTQVDLQGWSIEALSPTTTLLTLLEQSDPKGWTNKTSIPTQMINTLAGIGEFAIKCGGPPVVTRLAGSKANELRYDHERGMFKVEYEPSASRRSSGGSNSNGDDSSRPAIESEIRCDVDTWAASLDIVVDPPPQSITCLRRHRLSSEGGGLWLTLTHDSVFVDDERLLAIVRRAPGKEKGLVMVNGAKVQVDVEELPEAEIKNLIRQKRVKPPRIPLDQPPVIGLVKRRKAEWSGSDNQESKSDQSTEDKGGSSAAAWASSPKTSSPLARFFTYAVDQAAATTQQAVAAMTPANSVVPASAQTLDPAKPPMQHALDALAWTQEFNSKPLSQDGWALVSDKGVVVHRKMLPEISPIIPVHKGFKVIEGVSAEELASVITEFDCRKNWDERFESVRLLESFGGQSRTTFMTAKGGFPFRDRGFYLASVMARECLSTSSARRSPGEVAEQSLTTRNAIFCVSTSFSPESLNGFSQAKYDPHTLPIGRVFIDAWMLETLDPYTKENYTIPSSRCTRLVAVDYAGSLPATFNANINATMARGVLALETYMRTIVKAPIPITRLPAPGLIISEKKTEETATGTPLLSDVSGTNSLSWKLKKRDESRVLLDTQFDNEKRVYRSSVLFTMPQEPKIRPSSSRREPSSATIVPAASDVGGGTNPSYHAGITPKPSHQFLSASPHRRQREPSGESLPETIDSTNSDATISAPQIGANDASPSDSSNSSHSSSAQSLLHTPMLPMPGAMSPGVPPPPIFPSSSPVTSNIVPSKSSTLPRRTENPVSPHSSIRHDPATSISPPRIRQRAASSGSNAFNLNARTLYHPDGTVVRGRTTSAAFGNKGDVRLPMANSNMVILEMVVDTKTYTAGAPMGWCGYAIDVRARKRGVVALQRGGQAESVALSMLGKGIQPSVTGTVGLSSESTPLSAPSSASVSSTKVASADLTDMTSSLPFIFTVHTIPASQLHSSGLSAERGATRHLMRLALPNAQQDEPSFIDPLTEAGSGDVNITPKSRPAWLEELEQADGGIVVEAVVRALGKGEGSAIKEKKRSASSRVWINGQVVSVVSEKESLSSLGREELLSDRISRTSVLSRTPNEADALPVELRTPVAVADDLLLQSVVISSSDTSSGAQTGLTADASLGGSGSASNEKQAGNHEGSEGGEDSPRTAKTEGTALHELAPGMASGLFGFLQSYGQNTLTMFGSGTIGAGIGLGAGAPISDADIGGASVSTAGGAATDAGASTTGEGAASSSTTSNPAGGDATATTKDGTSSTDTGVEGGNGTAATRAGRRRGTQGGVAPPMYPRSTLLFVALIAFLLGSLLRSLLSPADFIYVVTDGGGASGVGVTSDAAAMPVCVTPADGGVGGPSAPGTGVNPPGTCVPVYGTTGHGNGNGKSKALELAQSAGVGTDGSGWREIRRLLEIKYLVGGWDFQVAVVRRH